MAGSLATLAAITKKFYVENKVHDQLNQDSYLFDRLAKPAKKEVQGVDYTYAINTGRNRYAGRAIAEGGAYGTAGNQTVKNIVVPNLSLIHI